MDKFRLSTQVTRRVVNPWVRRALEHGLSVPGYALLETTGRKTGQPRRTPVGDGLDGDVFWIVTEHGRRSQYVRNIEANPRVRIKCRGRWRTATAQLMPDDDPHARQARIGSRANGAVVRAMGTEHLTVRLALDPD